jgi:hypothetical protein
LDADGVIALIVGEEEGAFVRIPGGEAVFEGVVEVLGVGGRIGGGEVCEGLEAETAGGLLFEEVAGDAAEEGGDIIDGFAFIETAGEAGESVVG